MKITLEELQAFLAVVDSGSLTAAAQQLGQTVSAASRALGRLEEKLQTTLMHRTTRRIELTEEGRAFLVQARAIIEAVEGAEEAMAVRRGQPSGRLRVDAATPFMLHVIVPLIQGYRERYPQVELELNSSEHFIDLLERRTDVAIRIGHLKDSTLHSRPIASGRLRILASPAYLARHGTPRHPSELLSGHSLLGFNQPDALNYWPLRDEAGERRYITPTIWASNGETLRQLALQDMGIVCLSDFMTGEDRASGRLKQILARYTIDERQPINAVYYRNTAISARIASFVDYLAEAVREASAPAASQSPTSGQSAPSKRL
ncbi:LysR family transcriptional regulator [Bordetella hinzii]|jgi:DNA-binding transcriptional LysR family regulator|uniref:LysR family transcriptional regulator n=2 Tax=Bordetella hinzii TaxID=103855 RepID=A0AAN1RZI2_9BORD|nr:LysR family transcriptional regulator [Bordetella hinzii]AKQ59876.1 HTH-type transcriptional regulator DmlR [Bordetella hinzii]AZW19011.1 LysR family transcriptional regulator [Bordetella hinzii]KCB24350.1 LysR substrate-binding domain protein [Bordetella hinzii OH87 BAL007II]KCB34179.1 LysR substrate-binding domain protein [Bordetella hinzii CA90 BAL1384]KCB40674.1 LysR substrate-binding domain protein [Bordetella hinzii 5132]